MKKIGIFYLLVLVSFLNTFSQDKYTISGYVRDMQSGESLIGVGVYVKDRSIGTITNEYGFYSLSLPKGKSTIVYSYLGYNTIEKEVNLIKEMTIHLDLSEKGELLKEVSVTAKKADHRIKNTEMSTFSITSKTLEKVPVMLGEPDIMKTIQFLPGVQTSSEGSVGFSVRGGALDQNLILIDDAPVYNASHLFGLFSTFNNDAINTAKLYKGYFPASYGGRLSSVLDIHMKEGNSKNIEGTAGIGTILSKLMINGPIVKDKGSFLFSARRSYLDVLANALKVKDIPDKLYFYDLNGKINWKFGDKDRVFFSSYMGRDIFNVESAGFDCGNMTQTLRWSHIFNSKLFSKTTLLYSDYNYKLYAGKDSSKIKLSSRLKDISFKEDVTWYLNSKNTVKFGGVAIYHDISPGKIEVASLDTVFNQPVNYAMEYGLYISNEQRFNRLTISYGARYAIFHNVGKSEVYKLNDLFRVEDTLKFKSKEPYNFHGGIEPRIGINYQIDEFSSVKLNYTRVHQFLQQASNSLAGSFMDIWFPTSPNIKPQIADQFALGYFRNMFDHKYEVSIEGYYKDMQNQIDFKDNAELLLNDLLEAELRTGKGWAYGLELLVKKNEDKFTGWLSYTYSRTKRKIAGINMGKLYWPSYDRPHNFTIVGNYEFSKRLSVSGNMVYKSGTPATLPVGKYYYRGTWLPVYGDKNAGRLKNYFRMDFSVNWKGKPNKRIQSEWVLSVFNATNYFNPMMYIFKNDDDNPSLMKASAYSYPIVPSISYNLKF